MKKIVFALLGLVMIISCGRPQSRKPVRSEFCNDVVIKTTPVLDQGRSPLCWAYAMLATIESEHLMQGDSVHLSALLFQPQRWPHLSARHGVDGL